MEPRIVIDFPLEGVARNPLWFGTPSEVLCATTPDQVCGVLQKAEACARAGAWVAGAVSYEAAPAFDAAMRVCRGSGPPLAWFGVFDTPLYAEPDNLPHPLAARDVWQPTISRAHFDTDIAAIRRAIFDGAVYQVNHTLRLHSRFEGSDLALFRRLQSAQPNGYSAYLNLGRWRILSVSPELFFRREGNTLTAQPMKGTAPRGRWPEEDRQHALNLQNSDKNRAENLMIVDLLRNDLARVAAPNSVRVPQLFSVEQHPTLWQMTSTITAETRPGSRLDDIFAALFPCGSVTGSPKIKAMEMIAHLETEPRGMYCGAIGLLRPGGDAVFNVAIRTVTIDAENRTATCGIGSGITWGSRAADEYAETLLKSRFLYEDAGGFDLLETLRLEHGAYTRLDLHLARLSTSASYFNRPFDHARCRQQLEAIASARGGQVGRVRIRLCQSGDIDIALSPLPDTVEPFPVFAIASEPVRKDSIWLYHKTTKRDAYDRAAATFPDAFDVLLWNEDRELTEFTRGNVVLEIEGQKLTPRIDSGLLNGCMRREMIEQGEIIEATLTLDDLARAQRIWFVNSLRGVIEMMRDSGQDHSFTTDMLPDEFEKPLAV